MPRVRYLGGGGYYIRDGPDFEREGDEADVGERTAERLAARPDFEVVEPPTGPDTCQTVKADGEVCGRALPCPYHTEDS
jgi:hypothetical protein